VLLILLFFLPVFDCHSRGEFCVSNIGWGCVADGDHAVEASLDALRDCCAGLSAGQSPFRRHWVVAIEFVADQGEGIAKDDVEIAGASRFDDFIAHWTEGLKEQLSDVAENRGVANRNAISPGEREELAEGMVDGLRGAEVVQRAEEFQGRFFGVTNLAILHGVLGA
jgi:hypothetical protein